MKSQIFPVPNLQLPFRSFWIYDGVIQLHPEICRKAVRNNGLLKGDVCLAIEEWENQAVSTFFFLLDDAAKGWPIDYYQFETAIDKYIQKQEELKARALMYLAA